MILKSKSLITILCLSVIGAVGMLVGAFLLQKAEVTTFAADGYVLEISAEPGNEQIVKSERLWFANGTSWQEKKEGEISFSDTAGKNVKIPADSFVHFENGAISTFQRNAVMSLDDFAQGRIEYYGMQKMEQLGFDGNSYVLGTGTDRIVFENYLVKTSDSKYLIGSPELTLYWSKQQNLKYTEAGFVELEYLSADKSVVLLTDGKEVWQFLTENAYIELKNGVKLDLATGELMQGAPSMGEDDLSDGNVSQEQSVFIDDIIVMMENALEVVENSAVGYPKYRFTVYDGQNGEDGTEGDQGEDGDEGDEGDEGEAGDEGETREEGIAGVQGVSGAVGSIGIAGVSGTQVSGVVLKPTVPVVSLKEWTVNGKSLKFNVYTDELSCSSIVEQTTRISLVDIGTGEEVYYWDYEGDRGDTGQQIDLSVDSADGFDLYCNALEPGHQYRFTVSADYLVNEVAGSQVLLSRTFKADDYGLSFELLKRDNKSFTFALNKTNRLVDVDSVEVLVNGVPYGVMQAVDFDSYEIVIGDGDYASQTFDISFRPVFNVTSFDANGEAIVVQLGTDGSISYDYTVTALKSAPTLGGVRLTAYDSGYLFAEALGEYDNGSYKEIVDDDDTIQSIRFELYGSWDDLKNRTNLVAEQVVTNGYITYFPVSEDVNEPIHTKKQYFLRAFCSYEDGEKTVEIQIPESYKDRHLNENEATGIKFALDFAELFSITHTTLEFVGADNFYNTVEDADAGIQSGVTFNAILGNVEASLNDGNRLHVSNTYPMELEISGKPDYHKTIKYNALNTGTGTTDALVNKQDSTIEYALSNVPKVTMAVDLDGLKADTLYMFTLYGYEKTGTTYNRIVLGSVPVQTKAENNITLDMEPAKGDSIGSIGINFWLEDKDAQNYYDISKGSYQTKEAYLLNTDAAYRSLYSITFELYRSDSSFPIGTCVIRNEALQQKTDENTLYEKFYGTNSEKTVLGYRQNGFFGTIGVGKDNFQYHFVDNKGMEITPGSLASGNYYVKAKAAYDYTEERFNYMDNNQDSKLYDYYTYKAGKEAYVNELSILGETTSEILEIKTLPYPLPGKDLQFEDGSYIKVENLLNKDLGAYNADPNQSALYSPNWDPDTVAGLKLTSKYKNDGERLTDSFYYYGYSYDQWNKELTDKDDGNKHDQENLPPTGYADYDLMVKTELAANDYIEVPEVWLLFYNERDLKYIQTAATEPEKTGIIEADSLGDEKGWLFMSVKKIGGKDVLIYYMNEKNFTRGKTYKFAFESELTTYTYEDYFGKQKTGFSYPESYYEDIKDIDYLQTNMLTSQFISVNRQKPIVYSYLEKAEQTQEYTSTATWKVYVNDPDYAIRWNSVLQASKNHNVTGGSTKPIKGGIYTLYGTEMIDLEIPSKTEPNEKDIARVTFTLTDINGKAQGAWVDTATVFDPQDPAKPIYTSNKLTEEQLKLFSKYLGYQDVLEDGKVLERGGKVVVSNLPNTGASYQMTADYILLDDVGFNSNSSFTNIPIVQHNFIGINDSADEETRLQLSEAVAEEDNNTMRIYLEPSLKDRGSVSGVTDNYYLGKSYLNKARTIAAVKVNVYNETTRSDIFERSSLTGKPTLVKKTLWLYPQAPEKGAADYRYYLRFKLSDLDTGDADGNIQYHVGDELRFDMEVYYLTGESNDLYDKNGIEGYTNEIYGLKLLNHIQQIDLYGTGVLSDTARYTYTLQSSVNDTGDGAGRSFYHVKPRYEVKGTLPWTQQISIESTTFDLTCTGKALPLNDLSNDGGYEGKSVLELMHTDKYKSVTYTEKNVASAIPTFESVSANGGIIRVNINGKVGNWNLVEYPAGEEVHFYYLVYKQKIEDAQIFKGDLVAAMIGEPTSVEARKGVFNLDLPLEEMNANYWIEVYYKDQTSAGEYFDQKTDAALFGTLKNGQLYLVSHGNTGAKTIETVLHGNQFFKQVKGITDNRLLAETGAGLVIDNVEFDLGNESAYTEKVFRIRTRLNTPVLDSEKDTLRFVYKLYQKPEGAEDTAWKVIIDEGDENNPADKNNPAKWTYYESGKNGKDMTRVSEIVESDRINNTTLKYFAGGKIVPGYDYKVEADVYQGNVRITTGSVESNVETWSAVDLTNERAFAQVANVTMNGQQVRLSYRMDDLSYTSVEPKYFVRLAEKTASGWVLLENNLYYQQDAEGNQMNRAFGIGTSYTTTYGTENQYLKPETTYRLQFYAMLDPEFDNKVNVVNGDKLLDGAYATPVLDLESYYPRTVAGLDKMPTNLSALYKIFFDNQFEAYDKVPADMKLTTSPVLVATSSEFTTLSADVTTNVGTYRQPVDIKSPREISLHFSGAFGADDVSMIEYQLTKIGGEEDWSVVTLEKADGQESLFDTEGDFGGHGVDGDIYLNLKLGSEEDEASMNVREKGKYVLEIRCYEMTSGGEQKEVNTYTITFNNTKTFE